MTEEELIHRRELLAGLERDGRGLVRADDISDAEVEALTFGEFLGLLWRPKGETRIDDLRDWVRMDRLVPGTAARTMAWARDQRDRLSRLGARRLAFLVVGDFNPPSRLYIEAARPDRTGLSRIHLAHRSIDPLDPRWARDPWLQVIAPALDDALMEIERERNRLVVSDISGPIPGDQRSPDWSAGLP